MGWTLFPNSKFKGPDHDTLDAMGRMLDYARHLALPVFCMVYAGFAYLAKQMRASMLENLSRDYVRTAKAKGVSGRLIILKHVLGNSLIPIITIFATLLPAMPGAGELNQKLRTSLKMENGQFEDRWAAD